MDLLYRRATQRTAVPLLDRALLFAFASGDTARAFERVNETATCQPSSFRSECFAADLFLDEFVERCLRVHVQGTSYATSKPYLTRVLSSPPSEPADVQYRQEIQRELRLEPSAKAALDQLYVELHALRALLASGDYTSRLEPNLRKLDVLRSLARIFQHMDQAFESCRSGLSQIHAFGKRVTQSSEFSRVRELLEYEQHSASLDLRVQVGADGSLRSFTLLGHRPNAENRFYSGWWSRLWSRLVLLLQGYRVSQRELLARLLDQTFEGIKQDVIPLFQLLGDVEFHLAGLGLVELAERAGLDATLPELSVEPCSELRLEGLFNPFLLAEGVQVHPCDVRSSDNCIVIVTGPNSGGKTRLLQSIGLAQVLAQAGLAVPAASASLGLRRGLFVSLINEVRADQAEGRLGMELLRIRRLFEQMDVGDLVVIDELCSGTNPSEGEEIFRLVVELLAELRPQVWLTTHFLSFAEQLQSEAPGNLSFLQVKLDPNEQPTFEFEPGVARTSLARKTAARLGVTREELAALVERAQARSQRLG